MKTRSRRVKDGHICEYFDTTFFRNEEKDMAISARSPSSGYHVILLLTPAQMREHIKRCQELLIDTQPNQLF